MKELMSLKTESTMNSEIISRYIHVQRENKNILDLTSQKNAQEMSDKNIPNLMKDILSLKDNKDTHGLNKSTPGPNKDIPSLTTNTLSLNKDTLDMTKTNTSTKNILNIRVAMTL